jgi:hypothetical protein
MKNTKLKHNQLHFSDLKEDDIIQVLCMNDYFSDSLPQPNKPQSVVDFIALNLQEMLDDDPDLSLADAYNTFCFGSGDGGENYCVLTIKGGEVYTVIPSCINDCF